jgi:molecular chaperone HscB
MKNHFEFYEIKERFFINEQQLKQLYLKISKENHPDFFINDKSRYDAAMDVASQNNTAYKVLRSFDSRVYYILKLNNLVQEQGSTLPSEFLIEMMDINEAIMDLKMDFDATKLVALDMKVGTLADQCSAILKDLAVQADDLHNTERLDVLKKIKEIYLKQKYVLRLKESLNTFAPQ